MSCGQEIVRWYINMNSKLCCYSVQLIVPLAWNILDTSLIFMRQIHAMPAELLLMAPKSWREGNGHTGNSSTAAWKGLAAAKRERDAIET